MLGVFGEDKRDLVEFRRGPDKAVPEGEHAFGCPAARLQDHGNDQRDDAAWDDAARLSKAFDFVYSAKAAVASVMAWSRLSRRASAPAAAATSGPADRYRPARVGRDFQVWPLGGLMPVTLVPSLLPSRSALLSGRYG